jgi:zinc D-Ala-D-Ala dipeptidase
MKLRRAFCSLLLLATAACTSAATPVNEYGLRVVDSVAQYERIVERNPSHRLVDLATAIPGAELDIRYATEDNFMEERLYPIAAAWLRAPAAEALASAERELAEQGIGLRIFDAYRPYSVTRIMWERIGDPDYVADPARGSRHNRGAAVDLTLIDLETGDELEMPTSYDDFTERAHHDFDDLDESVKENRRVLRETMERHGLVALASEWWHYDFQGWEQFDLLDIPLEELENLDRNPQGSSARIVAPSRFSAGCPEVGHEPVEHCGNLLKSSHRKPLLFSEHEYRLSLA